MSDFAIPGTGTDKYGTKNLIEGLMKIERVPRNRTETKIKQLQEQKSTWQDLSQKLAILRQSSQALYSFKNPFNEKIAKSSDENTLTATTTREAGQGTTQITVRQLASADRYLSKELPQNLQIPKGNYSFVVGTKEIALQFQGGSAKDFVSAINRKGADYIKAQLISVSPSTQSLVLESLKTGLENKLQFTGDSQKLLTDIGMIEAVHSTEQVLKPGMLEKWENPILPGTLGTETGVLRLQAGGEIKIPLSPPLAPENRILELSYRLIKLPEVPAPTLAPGPSLGPVGTAQFEGLTIQGEPSQSGLPEWIPPPPPPKIEDKTIAYILNNSTIALAPLQDGEGTLSLDLDTLKNGNIHALAFRMKDTTRIFEFIGARIYNPKEVSGYKPLQPVSVAQDAKLTLDGISINRASNSIPDLLPGVTLHLKSISEKPISLTVEPNMEGVKDGIITFVGNYNKLMGMINILTRKDEKMIAENAYLNEEERKVAKNRLGTMAGDSTLNILKDSLSRAMSGTYTTKDGKDLVLLSQLGISTDARKPGSGQAVDATKLRGYLEIDDEVLGKSLEKHFEAAKQLFGYDSNQDLIIDSGVAYSVESIVKPYSETAGIIALKTLSIDNQLKQDSKTLEEMDKSLSVKENQLKLKFGNMESALNRMRSSSDSINNFSKQNQE